MKSRKGQPGRGGSNLIALGSAAVLAVYTAGYLRTKPAADLLAAQSSMRRPPRGTAGAQGAPARPVAALLPDAAAAAMDSTAIAASVAAALTGTAPSPVPTMEAAPGSAGGLAAPTNPATASSAPAVPRDSTVAAPASPTGAPPAVAVATLSTPQAATVAPPATVPQPGAAPVVPPPLAPPVPSAPVPSAPVLSAPPKQQAAAPSTPAPAAPAPKAASPAPAPAAVAAAGRTGYKDGMFFGRGTSRHGDIESMVEISNGRIIGAVIARCLTQYSCSWIAALPPQVVTRQSPDVDYVTGATESANAFYFSIVQALSQAK